MTGTMQQAPPTDSGRVSAVTSGNRLAGWIGLPAALVALLVLGALTTDKFLTTGNLINILTGMSIVGIIVVGMTFVIITQGLADLSVPATVATGAIVVLKGQETLGTAGAIIAAVLVAGLAGAVNGVLIGYARANPIIVTLGIGTIVLGLAQALVGGAIVYGEPTATSRFLSDRILGVPVVVLIFLAVAAIGHLVLSRTAWGRWTYAVGSNYAATEASGVPVRRTRGAAFVLTGALSGFSGVLLGLTLLSARPVVGTGYEFDAITAVVVGGVSLLGGFGSIPRAMGGLLLVQLLTNLLVLYGVPTPVQGLGKGAIIALAVAVDIHLRRKGGR
jgi:ribose/xylose/arabinose/galactoside ABC-type transport system permease subunit